MRFTIKYFFIHLLHDLGELKIAEVDCTVSQSLCAKHSVKGYPTVMLFKDGVKHTTYDGNRHFPRLEFSEPLFGVRIY